MATGIWHYSRSGQRMDPVPAEQLRTMIASGAVHGTDLAWTDGMPDWAPIQSLPELTGAAPVPVTSVPVTPVGAVAYYAPTGGMPARAVESLRGHARPAGDTGD